MNLKEVNILGEKFDLEKELIKDRALILAIIELTKVIKEKK